MNGRIMKKSKFKLYSDFYNKPVQIITNLSTESYIDSETETKRSKMPIIFTGTLIDSDDHFLYLGIDEVVITRAVAISCVKAIEIVEGSSELLDLLDSIPKPDREEDIN